MRVLFQPQDTGHVRKHHVSAVGPSGYHAASRSLHDRGPRHHRQALDVLRERVYYRGTTTAGVEDSQYVKVLPCHITGGPVAATATAPGRPCIASRKFYFPWNLPDVPNKSDYLFDQEWIIWANDNGKYAN
jgi:hypothetical protein